MPNTFPSQHNLVEIESNKEWDVRDQPIMERVGRPKMEHDGLFVGSRPMKQLIGPNLVRIDKNVEGSRHLPKKWKRLAKGEPVEQKHDAWVGGKRKKDLAEQGLVLDDGMRGKRIRGIDEVLSNLEVVDFDDKALE